MKFRKLIYSLLLVFALTSPACAAHTRDWDVTDPLDHTLNKNWPNEIRDVKEDVGERLTAQFYGFASGETTDGVKSLLLIDQTSDPTVATNIAQIYGKVVSTKTEVFIEDEDANIIQVTTGGTLNSGALGGTLSTAILNQIYPVGIVVTFGVNTNPATLLGIGTWTPIEGKVIVGINASDTEFDTLNETGGAKTHTLTTDEMPAHTHNVTMTANKYAGDSGNSYTSDSGTVATSSTGGGGAHNNLQPYIVKYVWERIS